MPHIFDAIFHTCKYRTQKTKVCSWWLLPSHQVDGTESREFYTWERSELQLLNCFLILLFRTPVPWLVILYLNAATVWELTTPISNPFNFRSGSWLSPQIELKSLPTHISSLLNGLAALDNTHVHPTHCFPAGTSYKYESPMRKSSSRS